MSKKLNTLTLSGLIIGPILGSGIVLLPPLAYEMMGPQSIYAWLIIMALGAVFAYVFTELSIMSPGNEGVSIAIGKGLGPIFKEMASNFLISAVCFGPIAVLMIAAEYFNGIFKNNMLSNTAIALIFLISCALIIQRGVGFIGKLTFILSSLIGILILVGGISSLLSLETIQFPGGFPPYQSLGKTVLLLFWGIVGWEIVGNYVEDVENPKITLRKSMVLSLIVITIIYLISAFSLQNLAATLGTNESLNMSLILQSVFGPWSSLLLGLTASGLCICTYLMIVGGVTRLAASKAQQGHFPKILGKTDSNGTPINMLILMSMLHSITLLGVHMSWLNIESLVALANAFFIGNALLGLTAAFILIKKVWIKVPILILIISFTIMFLFSTKLAILFVVSITVLSYWQAKRHQASGTMVLKQENA